MLSMLKSPCHYYQFATDIINHWRKPFAKGGHVVAVVANHPGSVIIRILTSDVSREILKAAIILIVKKKL